VDWNWELKNSGPAYFFMNEAALEQLQSCRGFDLGMTSSLVIADGNFRGSSSTMAQFPDILVFTFNETGLLLGVGVHLAKITEYEPGD
jgi:hypothetical protein